MIRWCSLLLLIAALGTGCAAPDRDTPVGRDLSNEAQEYKGGDPVPGFNEGLEPAMPKRP